MFQETLTHVRGDGSVFADRHKRRAGQQGPDDGEKGEVGMRGERWFQDVNVSRLRANVRLR